MLFLLSKVTCRRDYCITEYSGYVLTNLSPIFQSGREVKNMDYIALILIVIFLIIIAIKK